MKQCLWNLKSYISARPLETFPSGGGRRSLTDQQTPAAVDPDRAAAATSLEVTKPAVMAQGCRSITCLICQW